MFVGCKKLVWMFLLRLFGAVLSDRCGVEFERRHICALRGSSVVALCSFYNSDRRNSNKFIWTHVKPNHTKARVIVSSNSKKVFEQFEYIGDRYQNCSMKIQQVESKYAGRYSVAVNRNRACPQKSLTLRVVDLSILLFSSNKDGIIKEGDSVNLSCTDSCGSDNPSSVFTWFKNREPVSEGQVFHFRNISLANSGNYTCSLKTQSGTTSDVRQVDVEYGPKNTSVLVGPSDGGDIPLMCSSDAHPPVLNYNWFKINDGQAMKVGHQFAFVPDDGGQYFCFVANKHGSQNSTVFTLKMKPYWATYTYYIIAAILVVTMIIAVCRLIKKRLWPQMAEREEETQNEDYVNVSMFDGGWSQDEGSRGETDAEEVVYATVIYHKKIKPRIEQQDSGDEAVIYSSVWRNQHLNHSYIEPSRFDCRHCNVVVQTHNNQ